MRLLLRGTRSSFHLLQHKRYIFFLIGELKVLAVPLSFTGGTLILSVSVAVSWAHRITFCQQRDSCVHLAASGPLTAQSTRRSGGVWAPGLAATAHLITDGAAPPNV